MSPRNRKQIIQIVILLSIAVIFAVLARSNRTAEQEARNITPEFNTVIPKPEDKIGQESDLGDLSDTERRKKRFTLQASLTRHNESKAFPGFTLYAPSGTETVNLLNMHGETVHTWNDIDADRARLLPNCNLLVLHGSKNLIKLEKWRKLRNRVSEYDWQGELVWSYTHNTPVHHDMQRLPNGNTVLLVKANVPQEYQDKISDPLRKTVQLKADQVIEVSPAGQIVYTWNAWEHIDINECGVRECPGEHTKQARGRFDVDDFQDWTHLNTVTVIPPNKWYDGGDERFKPGNFVIMPRNFWTIYVVSRDSGKIVWEYTGDYKGGLVGGHDATMIPPSYPGEGNILVFDNGNNKERQSSSFILEINPQTKQTDWVYDVGPQFFSRARGSVQRLANGNTLISEDRAGRVFEVTPDKETVWEYAGNMLIVRSKRYQQNHCSKLQDLGL